MKRSWRTYGVVLLAIAGWVACSKTPDDILPEMQMQQVLTDMMIAESMINTDFQKYKEDNVKEALYESVFRKNDITQAQYDSSLVWYGRNLDIYMKMYERISVDLDKRIAALGDVQAEADPSSNRDSVDVWPRQNSFTMEPNSLFNGVVVDINPESSYASGSSFVLTARFWGLKSDPKHKPEIRISAEQRDTILTTMTTVEKDGFYQVVLKTLPTRRVSRVYGSIRFENMDSTSHKIYVDSLTLMKYNYGTPFSGGE